MNYFVDISMLDLCCDFCGKKLYVEDLFEHIKNIGDSLDDGESVKGYLTASCRCENIDSLDIKVTRKGNKLIVENY